MWKAGESSRQGQLDDGVQLDWLGGDGTDAMQIHDESSCHVALPMPCIMPFHPSCKYQGQLLPLTH
jgi:hypothetical protein